MKEYFTALKNLTSGAAMFLRNTATGRNGVSRIFARQGKFLCLSDEYTLRFCNWYSDAIFRFCLF